MAFDALLGLDSGVLGVGSRLLIIAFIVVATRLAPFREVTPSDHPTPNDQPAMPGPLTEASSRQ